MALLHRKVDSKPLAISAEGFCTATGGQDGAGATS